MRSTKGFSILLVLVMVLSLTTLAYAENAGFIEPPASWDLTYDVVVVGGGFAGLSASYTAATNGSSVALIEKMPFVGGNSVINGGVYAAYTSKMDFYEKLGVTPDTPEKHIEDTINGGDRFNQPELVEQFVYGSPYFLNLMIDNGLELRETISRPGGHYGYRTYTTINQSGSDIVKVQYKLVQEAGVDIKLNTTMDYIYRERPMDGRVLGIRVQTKDGALNIKADKGVILATGGFAANPEMRQTYVPWITEAIPTTNQPGATGEGIRYAQAIGANTLHMAFIQLYPFADPNNGRLDKAAVIPFSGPSFGIVYVDVNGKRYVNEGERRDVCSMAALNSGGFPTFAIFNEGIYPFFTTKEDIETYMKRGRILKADTLEELAEKINAQTYQGRSVNMSGATLAATIEQHNEYIAQGVDPDFGKRIDPGVTLPMEGGPYYAIPQWPSAHHTMGGVQINTRAEVLDIFGNVIPGFYAAGEVVGGIHGTNRLGSNAAPEAAVYGMIAGEVVSTGKVPNFDKVD